MKPLPSANEKPPGVTAGRSDESFNFDDLSAQDVQASGGEPPPATTTTMPQDESRESREAKPPRAAAARSPSPSALSTASSASPLIRSNSSSSSSSSSTTNGSHSGGKHSTGWRPPSQTGAGQRRAHHLAPTSIAVAQLQQQQQRQQLAMQQQQQQQQEKSKSSPKMSKFSSGNKLAQMANTQQQQQVSSELSAKKMKKTGPKLSGQVDDHHEGKSIGYNFGKMMAHRASRFNEFWSVNKMRYMNLACLLMTLVCLFTILLFSKSGGGGRSLAPLDSPANQAQRLQQQQQHRHRFMAATNEEQPTTTASGEDEQEHPMESIDSIDRQPFVRSSSRKHALTMTSGGNDDERAADSTGSSGGGGGGNSADGFNLFDEQDSSPVAAPNGKRSLDDLLQDARRQLKRQQANEREAEETTTSGGGSTTQATSTEQPPQPPVSGDDKVPSRKLAPIIDPLLSQVLGDLDGFGLFKSIKSQLLEQLNQSTLASGNGTGSPSGLFAEGKPIIRRGKNGATIIMSFGGSLLDDKPLSANGSASTGANETSAAALPQSLGSALERLLLLPPPLAMMLGAGGKLPAQGFARITINSAEPTILRSSPFEGPMPLFARSPFMPLGEPAAQSPARMFAFGDSPSPGGGGGGGGAPSTGGGFMSMILRASSDLARQMDEQLSKSANQTQLFATTTTNSTQQTELKPEASQQQVKVAPGTQQPLTSAIGGDNEDTEVETFDVSRMMGGGARGLPRSPFHSLYSGGRALRPSPLIMIGSSSGGGGGEGDSFPFAMLAPPQSSPMPSNSMFMMSGSGSSQPPMSFSSVLSDIMSTMAREARGMAGRRGDPELDTPTRSRPDDGDEEQSSSSSWDEQRAGVASSRLRPRHRSFDSDGDSVEREDTPLFRRSSSSSSLLEHLLSSGGGGGGGGPHVTRRTFGTIRQTFRGPDGVTVERTIEMPPARGMRHFEVQAVPAGVRSQSISSRMDGGDSLSSSSSPDRAPAFARVMRELAPSPDSIPTPLFARGAPSSPLFGRLFRELEGGGGDATSEDEGVPTSSVAASHPAAIDRSDAQEEASEQEEATQQQESVEMPTRPGWLNHAAGHNHIARVHIAGPRVADQLPHHFSMPARAPLHSADEKLQQASSGDSSAAQSQQKQQIEYSHSSPSSPLFGFPALKPTLRSPGQVVAGVTEPLAAAGHRQPRAFVYHSNHELAARQQPTDQARPRSASNPVAPASASMVMGRRLDDFVDQRR